MQKLILVLLGLYFFYLGVDGVLTGETNGLGGVTTTSGSPINFTNSPIQFSVSIVTNLVGGGWLIRLAFKEKENEE